MATIQKQRQNKMADLLDRQDGKGKYASKGNPAISNKAKSGGSFPDLNKDGKITKADILKGRGVIAKSGMKMRKQAAKAIVMKKAAKSPMMKKGGKMAKCKSGCY